MPIYGVPQAGYNTGANLGLNVTNLVPGESIVLFDGTETPALGLKSVAFSRGYSPSGVDNGTSFDASGMGADMTIDVQVANENVDAKFTTVATLTPSSGSPDTGNAAYTDVGRSAFYRLYVSAWTSSTMPRVIAQR